MSTPIVGDAIPAARKMEEVARSGIPLAIVQKTALQDSTNPLNDRTISGKTEGAAYIAAHGTAPVIYELAVASGSEKSDPWSFIGGSATSTHPIQDVGVLQINDDPTSASWGSPPTGTMIQTAYVQQSFAGAPTTVSGMYVGTISKWLSFDADNGQRIEYFTSSGEHWTRTKLAGGWEAWIHVNKFNQEVVDAGSVSAATDPTLDTWGSPTTNTAYINGEVTGEFVGAPTNINAGDYKGIITKVLTTGTALLVYVTEQGREYQKLKTTSGWSSWQETGVAAKESIWAVKSSTATTTTTASLSTYVTAAIDMTKFNAVEQDFIGDLSVGQANEFKFHSGHANAYEIQIHGVITEASTGTSTVMTIQLHEGTSNTVMTGSQQVLTPVGVWGGVKHYTFNCHGFARLTANDDVTVQISSDAAGTFTVGDCIVVMKPLE